jgi:regulatory protein
MWRKRIELNEQRERIIHDVERSRKRTMDRAVRLLTLKPRSVGELRERLLEKSWTNDEIVDAVIERLKEYNYLNDEQFARDAAMSRLRQRPQGRRKLEHTLNQKKLDKDVVKDAIESAFEQMPEGELIKTAIEKRIRLKGRPNSRDDLKKFNDYLLRRGFSYESIREGMSNIGSPADDDTQE